MCFTHHLFVFTFNEMHNTSSFDARVDIIWILISRLSYCISLSLFSYFKFCLHTVLSLNFHISPDLTRYFWALVSLWLCVFGWIKYLRDKVSGLFFRWCRKPQNASVTGSSSKGLGNSSFDECRRRKMVCQAESVCQNKADKWCSMKIDLLTVVFCCCVGFYFAIWTKFEIEMQK